MTNFIAHVRQDEHANWILHDLTVHCLEVGKLASQFAGELGADIAKLQGERHDIGKYRDPFQKRIRIKSGYDIQAHLEQNANKASHSHSGAMQIFSDQPYGIILAYTIAGHHTGLPNWIGGGNACLHARLNSDNAKIEYQETLANLPQEFVNVPKVETLLPTFILQGQLTPETFHIWIRFLFSCLVDADFLDTESFMSPEKTALRGNYPDIDILDKRFWQYMAQLKTKSKESEVNTFRNQVLQSCVTAAEQSASIFTLTVPTGGGKTLSSMAFALTHAKKYQKKRIIYAIPFTSIIEQNAQVFKQIFNTEKGQSCVIEHHSNLSPALNEETTINRLASENWDAPIIVTTNVQLFESLFAHRTSSCRKIHNIVNSVIVLDEAQKIPRDFQKPITDMMRELSKNYGVTWVLCTATQPKLDKSQDSFGRIILEGLPTPYHIIPHEEQLAKNLQRVNIDFPKNNERLEWQEVATKITSETQDKPIACVLAIVNTRNDAYSLYKEVTLLDEQATIIHLSASMCPQHRKLLISFIRKVLEKYHKGKLTHSFYVISTQLIEAGVDVDFPVVYRAMTGLDSIAQSAGRCNREGRMQGMGKVVVFQPTKDAPKGELLQAQQTTYEILDEIKNAPLSPSSFAEYFRIFNAKGNPDKHDISKLLTAKREEGTELSIAFRTASETFKLINNQGVSVVCDAYHPLFDKNNNEQQQAMKKIMDDYPEDDWLTELEKFSLKRDADKDNQQVQPHAESPVEQWLTMLEKDKGERWIYRKLQSYTVMIPRYIFENNQTMFTQRAGLIVAKEYSFLTGVMCDFQPLPADECVW